MTNKSDEGDLIAAAAAGDEAEVKCLLDEGLSPNVCDYGRFRSKAPKAVASWATNPSLTDFQLDCQIRVRRCIWLHATRT